MGAFPVIRIWDGCDPAFAEAVIKLQSLWRPFSAQNGTAREWHLDRLIEELIDPVLENFRTRVSREHQLYILGAATQKTLSETIFSADGYKPAERLQHDFLSSFINSGWIGTDEDKRFVATLETLLDLLRGCSRKAPNRPTLHNEKQITRRINRRRIVGYCRFCGAQAEVTAVSQGTEIPVIDASGGKLTLSTFYCSIHRPKLDENQVNPRYRSALRSLKQFELELKRLGRQAGQRNRVVAQSGHPATDRFYYRYVIAYDLRGGDVTELRQHARRLVDAKLTDRKKQILVLERELLNQSEVAKQLGIERQSVSKSLGTISKQFRYLLMLH